MDESDIRFQTVEPESELHRLERVLRYEVLRKPLGMAPGTERFPFENEAIHGVAVDGKGQVVACTMLFPLPERSGVGRLMQVAVREDHRRRGLGARMVRFMEGEAKRIGCRDILIHARAVALDFWLALGYEIRGEIFEEVGIAHHEMWKTLSE